MQRDKKYVFALVAIKFGKNHRSRTWGLFLTPEEALESLFDNPDFWLEDNYYDHALIERVPVGPCTVATALYWYKASYNEQRQATLTKIDPPPESEGVCNFWGGLR